MSKTSKRIPISNWNIIRDQIKYVDLLIEVCDARAPLSSRHPKAKEIFANKPTLLILNKSDLADRRVLQQWLTTVNDSQQIKARALCLKRHSGKKEIIDLVKELTESKRQNLLKKGIHMPVIRVCVVGMPNVGKSSLINWLSGRKQARVADKPGVTRGPQWIKLESGLELLDTPGILPRENLDSTTVQKLALLNLVTGNPIDAETLGESAMHFMEEFYPLSIKRYLHIDRMSDEPINLDNLAQKRNFLLGGGKYNRIRAANTLISDLRCGKLGGIFLDKV